MKLGAEKRGQKIMLIVLALLAVVSLTKGFMMLPHTSTAAIKQPDDAALRGRAKVVDPQLRLSDLDASRQVFYKKQGPAVFSGGASIAPTPTIEKPIRSPLLARNKPTPTPAFVDPGPPPPPPIDLKYFGQANSGGRLRAFLAHGSSVYVVQEGEMIERRYRVLRVTQNSVEIEDLFYNNRKTLPYRKG